LSAVLWLPACSGSILDLGHDRDGGTVPAPDAATVPVPDAATVPDTAPATDAAPATDVAPATDAVPAPDAATGADATPGPAGSYAGPIGRSSDKHLLTNGSLDSPSLQGLSLVRDLINRAIYINDTLLVNDAGLHDHSAAGIAAHGLKVFNFVQTRMTGEGAPRAIWFDLEHGNSIHVPASVGYDPGTDGKFAAVYSYRSRTALRTEAIRYQDLVAKSVIDRTRAAGDQDFEVGWYNIPGRIGSNPNIDAAAQIMYGDARVLLDTHGFGGVSCYFSITASQAQQMIAGTYTMDQYIDSMVANVVAVKQKFVDQKIYAVLWPYFWYTDVYPFGSKVVPAGAMRQLATRLLAEADVDGFFFWHSSGDDDPSVINAAERTRWNARYEEVAEVVLADGRFRVISY
jgi:hypothetical protein